jgi:hypothetical protein
MKTLNQYLVKSTLEIKQSHAIIGQPSPFFVLPVEQQPIPEKW